MIPYTKNVSLKLRELGFQLLNTRTIDNPENKHAIEKYRTGLFLIDVYHEKKIVSLHFFGYDRMIPLTKINSINQLKKIMDIFGS